MTTASMATDNPFVDPTSFEDGRGALAADTLALGRSISLTLGTDALIVLGEPLWSLLGWIQLIPNYRRRV